MKSLDIRHCPLGGLDQSWQCWTWCARVFGWEIKREVDLNMEHWCSFLFVNILLIFIYFWSFILNLSVFSLVHTCGWSDVFACFILHAWPKVWTVCSLIFWIWVKNEIGLRQIWASELRKFCFVAMTTWLFADHNVPRRLRLTATTWRI